MLESQREAYPTEDELASIRGCRHPHTPVLYSLGGRSHAAMGLKGAPACAGDVVVQIDGVPERLPIDARILQQQVAQGKTAGAPGNGKHGTDDMV